MSKIGKNRIFDKNHDFQQEVQSVWKYRIWVEKWSLGIKKSFFTIFRCWNVFRTHFWKINFLTILGFFKLWVLHFLAQKCKISCKNAIKNAKSYSLMFELSPTKNGYINSTSIRKSNGFNVHDPFWPKPMYLFIYRFGYKKASKMKKFLHQQNLQNLSFLWNKKSSQYLF